MDTRIKSVSLNLIADLSDIKTLRAAITLLMGNGPDSRLVAWVGSNMWLSLYTKFPEIDPGLSKFSVPRDVEWGLEFIVDWLKANPCERPHAPTDIPGYQLITAAGDARTQVFSIRSLWIVG